MPQERTAGKPTTRRYTDEEKAQAVRLVRQLRRELGTEHGTIQRVAAQLGYGVETVRKWVKQADVDEGLKAGTSSEDAATIKELKSKVADLEATNEILRKASAYFAQAELDRPWK
jgi:transposase-like protein